MSGNLENSMVLPERKYDAGTCVNCGTQFQSSFRPQRDEDGHPDCHIYTGSCADCSESLCDYCRENGAAHICADGKTRCAKCAAKCDLCGEWHARAEVKDYTDHATGAKILACVGCIESQREEKMEKEREKRIQALRETADFLEAHPEIPAPSVVEHFVWGEKEFRTFLGLIDGIPHTRKSDSNYLKLEFTLPGGGVYGISYGPPLAKAPEPQWPEPIHKQNDIRSAVQNDIRSAVPLPGMYPAPSGVR